MRNFEFLHREIQAKWPTRATLADRFSVIRRIPSNYQRHSVWGIENRLHWRLDVTMNEDAARNRMDNGPYNFAILRHMALNVMGREESKASLRAKFKKAAWNQEYLNKLLALF